MGWRLHGEGTWGGGAMVSAAVLALAGAAVWCWPAPQRVVGGAVGHVGGGQLPRVGSRWAPGGLAHEAVAGRARLPLAGARSRRLVVAATASAGAALGATTAGPPGGIAAAMVVGTAAVLVLRTLDRRRTRRALGELSAGLRLFGREIAAGASAVHAAEAVAATGGGCASLFGRLAGESELGALLAATQEREVGRAGSSASRRDAAEKADEVTAIEARLRAVWSTSLRHGIPLAATVRALCDDVDERRSARQRRETQTAGPVLSGYLLSGLPVAGLALGGAMGAHPVRILTGTALGGVLLVVGTGLTCAGLLWSTRLAAG